MMSLFCDTFINDVTHTLYFSLSIQTEPSTSRTPENDLPVRFPHHVSPSLPSAARGSSPTSGSSASSRRPLPNRTRNRTTRTGVEPELSSKCFFLKWTTAIGNLIRFFFPLKGRNLMTSNKDFVTNTRHS